MQNTRLKIFSNIAALAQTVKNAAQDCELVTFDLFDTLLVRRMADPDQIKPAVARYIAQRATRCQIAVTWQKILELRNETETRHRTLNGQRFPDHEAIYPQFMAETLQKIFGEQMPVGLLEDVTNYELRMESSVLVPRAAMLDLLRDLRTAGKTIWIMTDIYLPSTHIRILLERASILPLLDGVVSSADACQAKASGAGFEALRERLNLDPRHWLHIGDNIHSDGHRPTALGIRSFVLRDAGEAHRKLVYRAYHTAALRRPFWRGRLWQQQALPLEAENQSTSELYNDGYNFFGPLATAFVRHVAEQARTRNLKRIYFFSREGSMFLRIWQTAAPIWFPDGDAPEARYLYVSRLALAPTACARKGLIRTNAPMALLPARNRDLRDVCRVFGLEPMPLLTVFRKHHLEPDTPLSSLHAGWTSAGWNNFEQLLQDDEFQDAVREQTAERGKLLEEYLEQEKFFEQPEVAVVDIGWLGTIQRFLFDAIEHRSDCPRLHGFMLAATHGIPYPTSPKNDIEGFVFDRRQYNGAGGFITNSLNIFEEACREPAPGVSGYAKVNGKIKPVRMTDGQPARRAEMDQDTFYAPLQKGMLDFANRGAPALELLNLAAADLLPWLKHCLAMRMAFPKATEVQRLRWRHHLDEYEGRHRPPLNIRMRLTGLWDLPPRVLRWIPGLRTLFFIQHTVIWRGWILLKKARHVFADFVCKNI